MALLPVKRVANLLPATVKDITAGLINRQWGPKSQFVDCTSDTSANRERAGGMLYILQSEWDRMS